MHHKASWFFGSVLVLSAMLVLSLGYVQAQMITGYIPVFVDEDGNLGPSIIFQMGGAIVIGNDTVPSGLRVNGADNPAVVGSSISQEGIIGISTDGVGVRGTSTSNFGVLGRSNVIGVLGEPTSANGTGVSGTSTNGVGVSGTSGSGHGVYGVSTSGWGGNFRGRNGFGGVVGIADPNGNGVQGESYSPDGVGVAGFNHATSGLAVGVGGGTNSPSGIGVVGFNNGGGRAGSFNGRVEINGNLNVSGILTKGGGSFKIDHPLDPANQYLYHSFVESPDMMNIYNGNVVLDAHGEAVVKLPEWFEALNRDFRYQLTCIGGFAPIYIAEKIANSRFKIAGGQPGMEVSWQVTGIRQDAFANAHRIPVEEKKPAEERGYYLHPAVFGQPEEKGIEWANNPKMMQWIKEQGKNLQPTQLQSSK